MRAVSNHSVEIGKGIGNITFGLSSEAVEQRLGAPDESETLDPGRDSTVMWYYAGQQLQIVFQQSEHAAGGVADDVKRIVQLTTSDPEATLWGVKLIGQTENEVLGLFAKHGYDDFVQCGEPIHLSRYKSFRLESLRLTLGFHGGLLQRILWGRLNEDGCTRSSDER